MSTAPLVTVPEGFTLHTENSAHILLPATKDAFLNPIQEFNRDLSVACIRVWSEQMNAEKEAKWRKTQERKATGRKRAKLDSAVVDAPEVTVASTSTAVVEPFEAVKSKEYKPNNFIILEALSATGLRSIRYAKEIPLVKHVIANDLSPDAVAAMKRNIEINGLGPSAKGDETMQVESTTTNGTDAHSTTRVLAPDPHVRPGKVRVNEGDACSLMYAHRSEKDRVDVVDLDPYGTAAPFIDAAVQCVSDGGLLCVTCTDLSVLATTNYPEKCFANYGGAPVKAEYCHEAALRLVLHSLATSAARYGRYIEPLLSLSIDFYVRLFVRVRTQPIEVKKLFANTATYYVCTSCQSFHEQPLGRAVEKPNAKTGAVDVLFKTAGGPSTSGRCDECDSPLHVAGPMWSAPIHNTAFVEKVLAHLEANSESYGTVTRMKGMLTVAKEELHSPFYFTPTRIAGAFHSTTPSLDNVASALLHAGHGVSRSHACPGSLKTTAPRTAVHDIFRSWVKLNPVNMSKIGEASPARKLLAKEPITEANFERHPQSVTAAAQVKLVRYQQNPTANWGPGARPQKRRREEGDE